MPKNWLVINFHQSFWERRERERDISLIDTVALTIQYAFNLSL